MYEKIQYNISKRAAVQLQKPLTLWKTEILSKLSKADGYKVRKLGY